MTLNTEKYLCYFAEKYLKGLPVSNKIMKMAVAFSSLAIYTSKASYIRPTHGLKKIWKNLKNNIFM